MKKFEQPELEIIKFEYEDIMTSGVGVGNKDLDGTDTESSFDPGKFN